MENEWVIEHKSYGLIRISKILIDQLLSYRQLEQTAPESGGVLIGKHLNSNGAILIDGYTPPQETDKQSRYRYYRSSEHNRIVQDIWRSSNQESTYVGLWHTHAEAIPSYSHVDKTDWKMALNRSRYEGPALFFFIIGQTHIRCWIGIKRTLGNKIELIGEYDAHMVE